MHNIFDPIDLDLNQVRVIVQAMVRVAQADGVHDRELVLIREFYEACREEVKGLTDFHDILQMPFDAAVAREALATDERKQTLLASCYLVAYADGALSSGERGVLDELARELAIEPATVESTRERIKDLLVMQLARSDNMEALQRIAASL